ncbi:T3SS effector HopA1 family protein [Streptomyces sp. CRN 30]|uniref:T3SS effector HopA1 family protein n=1 Tax=Streptomyces sp. CRN 30 TaxID=3075613 RepID=UPI002A83769C|nr:T3SS effector HopA1 family protein [Streptomyces sp. CRN 30]
MNAAAGTLPDGLRAALEEVTVSPDLTSATVGARQLTADTPHALRHRLSAALYEAWHTGRETPRSRPRTLRDPAFEQRLAAAMPHRSTTVVARVLHRAADGTLTVQHAGLRIDVPAAHVEPMPPSHPHQQVDIRVDAARPALSPGFFLADGTRPLTGTDAVLRVYLHPHSAESAVEVWRTVLEDLEHDRTPYRAKVCSSPWLHPRRDALVVYLLADAWTRAQALARAAAGTGCLADDVSVFARRLAPGAAAAWEPSDGRPFMRGMSFGQHRAAAVTDGLLAHAAGHGSSDRHEAVATALVAAGVDPGCPAHNLTADPYPLTPHASLPEPHRGVRHSPSHHDE